MDRSNWAKATEMECPKCGAADRPGATIIDKQQDGSYVCMVCAHHFRPKH